MPKGIFDDSIHSIHPITSFIIAPQTLLIKINGASSRNRTDDQRFTKPLLYR
jgi:hypothetical protein